MASLKSYLQIIVRKVSDNAHLRLAMRYLLVMAILFWSATDIRAHESVYPLTVTNKLSFGLELDAVVSLRSLYLKTWSILFVRYQVVPTAMRAEVVWAEPFWNGVNFCVTPPSTIVYWRSGMFVASNSLRGFERRFESNQFAETIPFRHKFNSYAIEDTRHFAWRAERDRVRLADVPIDGSELPVRESGRTLRATIDNRRISELVVKDRVGSIKTVEFEYNLDSSDISRQHVFLAPARCIGSLSDSEIKINGRRIDVNQVDLVRYPGGRSIDVKYRKWQVGGMEYTIPSQIDVFLKSPKGHPGFDSTETVRDESHVLLQSCRVYDVRSIPLNKQVGYMQSAAGRFDEIEKMCLVLCGNEWRKKPSEIRLASLDRMRELRRVFAERDVLRANLGTKLRNNYMQAILSLMLGDSIEYHRLVEKYENVLHEAEIETASIEFCMQQQQDFVNSWMGGSE